MRITLRMLMVVMLVGCGYFLGTMKWLEPQPARAQGANQQETTNDKIKAAYKALENARLALESDGKYKGVIEGVNAFAVTVGGVDAKRDLDEGRGVDPETFAAIYAGQYTADIKDKLKKDDQGRMLYNNKVIRLYSVERLKKLYQKRTGIIGIKQGAY